MIYTHKEKYVLAFQLGVDNMPDWFMDQVTANNVILRTDYLGRTYAEINCTNGYICTTVQHGAYILINDSCKMWSMDKVTFHDTYVEAESPKVEVNQSKPDPEEEREIALREHYWSCAKEIKLAYESLTTVGFREDEAFAILMKMMENPIKPPKRSKEDVIREFNKWRAERKERVNNDS